VVVVASVSVDEPDDNGGYQNRQTWNQQDKMQGVWNKLVIIQNIFLAQPKDFWIGNFLQPKMQAARNVEAEQKLNTQLKKRCDLFF
jgi:hypothetical protein